MKRYKSEQDVLNALSISDWRHMSKNKIMAFASEIPNMNPEVAKAAIAQFPEFVKLSTELVKELQVSLETIVSNAKEVNLNVLEQDKMILNALLDQLPNVKTLEERQAIVDAIVAVSNSEHTLADKHDKFLLSALEKIAKSLAAIGITAVAVIGGAKVYQSVSDNEKEDDDYDD